MQESLIRTQSEAQQRAELEEKLARLMNILGELPPEVATRRLSDFQGVSGPRPLRPCCPTLHLKCGPLTYMNDCVCS